MLPMIEGVLDKIIPGKLVQPDRLFLLLGQKVLTEERKLSVLNLEYHLHEFNKLDK